MPSSGRVGGRLVGEAARAPDRLAVRDVAGRDLEDEAVRLLEELVGLRREVGRRIGPVHRLLAGDPCAPRHPSAGAVHHRAVEARPGLDDLSPWRDEARGRAAEPVRVVRVERAEGVLRVRLAWGRVVLLVVPNEPDVAVGSCEGGHAVVPPGEQGAVVEGYRRCTRQQVGVVERPVLEPRSQVQPHDAVAQVGHRGQRPVGARRHRVGQQRLQRPTDEHTARRRHCPSQECPSTESVHAPFPQAVGASLPVDSKSAPTGEPYLRGP